MITLKHPILTWTIVFASCLTLQAKAQTPPTLLEGSIGAFYEKSKSSAGKQGQLVVYRSISDGSRGVATVYVNGQYHASLLAGTFSAPLCLPPGTISLGLKKTTAGTPPSSKQPDTYSIDLAIGQITYVRIQEYNHQLHAQKISTHDAESTLAGYRQQAHSISRVKLAVSCAEQ